MWLRDEWRKFSRVLGWLTTKHISIKAVCTDCQKQIVKVADQDRPAGVGAVFICGCTRREVQAKSP